MQFSIGRMKNLILRDSIVYRKPILYGLFSLVAFSLFIFWLPTADNGFQQYDTEFWIGWFASFLFIGGLLFTSILFWEFRTAAGRIQYLSIPATNAEKLLTRTIYSHLLFPGFLSLFFVISFQSFKLFKLTEPIDEEFFQVLPYFIGTYFSLVTLMLIFAIIFNKYVAPKAIIVSVIIYLLAALIGCVIFRLVMNDLFYGMTLQIDRAMTLNSEELEPFGDVMLSVFKVTLLIILPIFLWVVAYFKMNEKQV